MYAVMGGFIVEIGHLHNKLKFATLTTNGILLLAKEGKVVVPYPGSISDKSQMDILTKVFVCCQALSFIGQVIERKIAHLTISLLELNTAVHILCTLVMYGFWLQKPYNIQDPVGIWGKTPSSFRLSREFLPRQCSTSPGTFCIEQSLTPPLP